MLLLLTTTLQSCSPSPLLSGDAMAAAKGNDLAGLWVLQIRRTSWKPRDLEFVLRVEPNGEGVATMDPVFIGRTTARLHDLSVKGDDVQFSLYSKMDGQEYRFEARREGGTLDGRVRWHDGKREQTDSFTGFRRDVRRFDVDIARFPVEEDPRKVGIEPVLLDRLLIGAETARSDALFVLVDGRLVAARTFGGEDAQAGVGALSSEIAEQVVGQTEPAIGLRPSELAALGQAVLDEGVWTGDPVVPDRWVQALALPDPSAAWTVQPDPNDATRPPVGFGHITSAGEALLVYPAARLVVVRTLHRTENRYDRRYDDRDGMEWLDEMSESIAVEKLGLTRSEP